MSIDPNAPAFPEHGTGLFGQPETRVKGMTYHQWLVGTIAAGICSGPTFENVQAQGIAAMAVSHADAIIAALNAEDGK